MHEGSSHHRKIGQRILKVFDVHQKKWEDTMSKIEGMMSLLMEVVNKREQQNRDINQAAHDQPSTKDLLMVEVPDYQPDPMERIAGIVLLNTERKEVTPLCKI